MPKYNAKSTQGRKLKRQNEFSFKVEETLKPDKIYIFVKINDKTNSYDKPNEFHECDCYPYTQRRRYRMLYLLRLSILPRIK